MEFGSRRLSAALRYQGLGSRGSWRGSATFLRTLQKGFSHVDGAQPNTSAFERSTYLITAVGAVIGVEEVVVVVGVVFSTVELGENKKRASERANVLDAVNSVGRGPRTLHRKKTWFRGRCRGEVAQATPARARNLNGQSRREFRFRRICRKATVKIRY